MSLQQIERWLQQNTKVKKLRIRKNKKRQTQSFVGKALGFSHSTIKIIVKNKMSIVEHVKCSGPIKASIIIKQHLRLIIEMKRILLIWLEDQK